MTQYLPVGNGNRRLFVKRFEPVNSLSAEHRTVAEIEIKIVIIAICLSTSIVPEFFRIRGIQRRQRIGRSKREHIEFSVERMQRRVYRSFHLSRSESAVCIEHHYEFGTERVLRRNVTEFSRIAAEQTLVEIPYRAALSFVCAVVFTCLDSPSYERNNVLSAFALVQHGNNVIVADVCLRLSRPEIAKQIIADVRIVVDCLQRKYILDGFFRLLGVFEIVRYDNRRPACVRDRRIIHARYGSFGQKIRNDPLCDIFARRICRYESQRTYRYFQP